MKDREYIEEALKSAIISALGDIEVVVENLPEVSEDEMMEKVELYYMPSDVFAATMGDTGEDEHRGMIQCNILAQVGSGTARQSDIAYLLTSIFTAGHKVWYNSTKVTIIKSAKEQSFRRGAWWVVPVSIYWYSRVKRGV